MGDDIQASHIAPQQGTKDTAMFPAMMNTDAGVVL